MNANRAVVRRERKGGSVPRRRSAMARTVAVMRAFQPDVLAIQETPAAPFTGVLLWSMVSLLLVALAWAWIGRIPIMTTAPGKFASDANTKIVQSLNTGTISGILAKPGDLVTKGQPLVVLNPQVDRQKYLSAAGALGLNRLEMQRALVELGRRAWTPGKSREHSAMAALETSLAAAQRGEQRSKVAEDRALVVEAQANLAAGDATLAEYKQRLRQDRELAEAAAPALPEGAISGQEYIKVEDQVISDQGDLASQQKKVVELAAAVASAQKQLDKDVRTFTADRYKDLESAASKNYDLSSQYRQADLTVKMDVLRAPIDGVVQSMAVVSLGSVVQSGQTIAIIEPSRAPLVVEADLPAQDAGFVKVGQAARIKVTAYPFEQYGSIPGRVLWISPTADPTSDLSAIPIGESHQPETPSAATMTGSATSQSGSSAPPTLYYRVKILPERTWLDADGVRRTMRAGMTVSIDIATGHRRVLEFFIDPILKYVNSGMVVR